MKDPTAEEMREYLSNFRDPETSELEVEEAIYWFASNYHSGQWSNLYSALSTSKYTPSPLERECNPMNRLYELLVEHYA